MSIDDTNKRGRGRPETDTTAVQLRLDRSTLDAVDGWRNGKKMPSGRDMTRPEAIRQLLEAILKIAIK